ncbi:MAG: sugar phosphate isomerase/epimerase family protein [Planctomycetota bacterium]
MKFSLGYNTNGLAHHTLEQCIELCSKYGYQGIAITLDTHHLNPLTSSKSEILYIQKLLRSRSLRVVIETGGRFLLDIERKHYPTLLHFPGFEKRLFFLERALEIADLLSAEALSFWSGILPKEVSSEMATERLTDVFQQLLKKAHQYQIPLALEPEPGMFVETVAQGLSWTQKFQDPLFGLTLDLGHLECVEPYPLEQHIILAAPWIKNVHVDDIRHKQHEHLPLGEGSIDFVPLLKALEKISYSGLLAIELSRNSHNGPEQMRCSKEYLETLFQQHSIH